MKQSVLVDLRNAYRPEELNGFTYYGIGRGEVRVSESTQISNSNLRDVERWMSPRVA